MKEKKLNLINYLGSDFEIITLYKSLVQEAIL